MTVITRRHGDVLVLTINRPEVRNALDHPTLLALRNALAAARTDRTVRVVVLTGAGDRAFSSGLDLKALALHGVPDPASSPVGLLRSDYPKPVIAAVNGPAVGGGFELALACDLVVMAEHAYFALPEVSRGIAATEGGTELPQRLPVALALEIGLTGDPLPADRAFARGLVNRVVPGEEVLATALTLAMRIGSHSPAAVAATKALMYTSLSIDQVSARARAQQLTAELLAGPDAAEGAAAFVDKRPPRWSPPRT